MMRSCSENEVRREAPAPGGAASSGTQYPADAGKIATKRTKGVVEVWSVDWTGQPMALNPQTYKRAELVSQSVSCEA